MPYQKFFHIRKCLFNKTVPFFPAAIGKKHVQIKGMVLFTCYEVSRINSIPLIQHQHLFRLQSIGSAFHLAVMLRTHIQSLRKGFLCVSTVFSGGLQPFPNLYINFFFLCSHILHLAFMSIITMRGICKQNALRSLQGYIATKLYKAGNEWFLITIRFPV